MSTKNQPSARRLPISRGRRSRATDFDRGRRNHSSPRRARGGRRTFSESAALLEHASGRDLVLRSLGREARVAARSRVTHRPRRHSARLGSSRTSRRRNRRTPHRDARHRTLDRGDVPVVRPRSPRRVRSRRLRFEKGFHARVRHEEAPRDVHVRTRCETVVAVAKRRVVVPLARGGKSLIAPWNMPRPHVQFFGAIIAIRPGVLIHDTRQLGRRRRHVRP